MLISVEVIGVDFLWFVWKMAGECSSSYFGCKTPTKWYCGHSWFLGAVRSEWISGFVLWGGGGGEWEGGGLLVGPFREVPRNRSSIGRGGRNVVASLGITDVFTLLVCGAVHVGSLRNLNL